MAMRWRDLLFMHWPVSPEAVRWAVPSPLELDLFDGQAWIGVVPFLMEGVRPRCVPALPRWLPAPHPSCFPELNVRTYVRLGRKAGVFFFSLDAASRLAVRVARRFFHLPYFHAHMAIAEHSDGWRCYLSRRIDASAPPATLSIRYRPQPGREPIEAAAGTIDHFVTERYCLFTADSASRILCGDIHHRMWPLQAAEVKIERLDMTRLLGLELTQPPLAHFARQLRVVAWNARPQTAAG